MLQIENNGTSRARVFGPTGAVMVVDPGETIEVGFDESEIEVEDGGSVEIKQKTSKTKTKQKDGE